MLLNVAAALLAGRLGWIFLADYEAQGKAIDLMMAVLCLVLCSINILHIIWL